MCCARTLPEQDLRIVAAVPTVKLSADILWKEYQDNAREADRKYWNQAILVTGVVTSVVKDGPLQAIVMGQSDKRGVRAQLLDEQAGAILADAAPGARLTLKCFCAGLKDDVQLKSCVRPTP